MSNQPLEIERQRSGERTTLLLKGDCTLASGDRLWSAVEREMDRGRELQLDFSAVGELDGACAALLQSLRLRARRVGRSIDVQGADPESLALPTCPSRFKSFRHLTTS